MIEKDINFTVEIIEELNNELVDIYNSREYRLGKNILALKNYIFNFDIKGIHKLLRDKYAFYKVKKQYSIKEREIFCNTLKETYEKKIVVYTCIVGNYDVFNSPISNIWSNVDFVLFTDMEYENINGWEVYSIPEEIRELKNNTLINRYIKMHPYKFFGDKYDYSIYVDGNVKIVGDPYTFLGAAKQSVIGTAMYIHKERDCAYDEEKVCELYGKGNKKNMREQITRYSQAGFPQHFGLFEATMIVTDLNKNEAENLLHLWWEEFVYSKSYRDQISFPYVLWKNEIELQSIGKLGNNILEDTRVRVVHHTKQKTN
uniref:glycosyltransferase domain-containing protein n=1 Tax=Acetatifactor sp. TaxID=1872090 RepID=UPI004055CFEE